MKIGDQHVIIPPRDRTAVFSFVGTPDSTVYSGPHAVNDPGKVFGVRVLLGTTGTSNTVVTVYKNGSSIGTVTLGSGVDDNSAAFSPAVAVASSDRIKVRATTVGAGMRDPTVYVWIA